MKKIYQVTSILLLLLLHLFAFAEQVSVDSNKTEFKLAYTSYIALSEEKKWSESLPHAKTAYDLGKTMYVDKPETLAALTDNYGLNLLKLKQFDEAKSKLIEALGSKYKKNYKAYLKRALALSEKHYGENSANYGQALVEAALISSESYQSTQVKNYLEKGHGILVNTLGESHPRTGIAAFNLGRYEFSKNRLNSSVNYLENALKSFEFVDKPSNPYELTTHGILVKAYEQLNQSEKATDHCLAIGRMTPRDSEQDPEPLFKMAPVYPAAAARSGKQGYVTVQYDIDEQGFVINTKVVDGSPRSEVFEEASVDAAKRFRYAPGFEDGVAVVTKDVKNKFTFSLSY